MSILSRRQKYVLLKFFSMFSVVRGYNILVIIIAQYLTSVFIMAKDLPLGKVIFDPRLLLIVLSTAAVIAAGYIINNFYDYEKDLINRPQKSMLDRLVSQNTKLTFYFVLNISAAVMSVLISWRALLFFSAYAFAIWFYSHKLKKLPIIGNLISAILTITPFFAIFVYYKNFESVIFVHAVFLFLLISMRELIKDLENLKGDLALGYKTIPIVYGEKTSKWMITYLVVLTMIPVFVLISSFDIGRMDIYFYLSSVLLVVLLVYVWRAQNHNDYLFLHNGLKFIIVIGVFSIVLIEPQLILNRI